MIVPNIENRNNVIFPEVRFVPERHLILNIIVKKLCCCSWQIKMKAFTSLAAVKKKQKLFCAKAINQTNTRHYQTAWLTDFTLQRNQLNLIPLEENNVIKNYISRDSPELKQFFCNGSTTSLNLWAFTELLRRNKYFSV